MLEKRWTVAAVFTVCALPRLFVLWLAPPPELTFYWGYASNLLEHATFGVSDQPDTQVEPLYPAFLAAARWLTRDRTALVLITQILVAALGGVLLYRLASMLLADTRAAWIAVALYAFDPYLVRQSVGLMEVTVLTTLLIAIAWSFPKQPAVTGVLIGAAMLTRFAMVPLAIFIPLLLWRRSRRHAAIAFACVWLVVLPWSIRSYRVDRSLMPSRAGVNLALSLTDAGEQLLPRHNADRLVVLLEDKTDNELLASALVFAREQPWRTLQMKARNFVHVFNPRLLPYAHEPVTARLRSEGGRYWIEGSIPRPPSGEWIHGLWRAALLLLAILGVWRRGFRWDDGVLWAVVGTLTLVCTVFFPTTRLTTPMVWTWMLFAASALARLRG